MGKNAASEQPKNSLKTFYLYALGVFALICISLLIRAFVLFQQNVFDPSRHFTLAVVSNGAVREIIGFNPQTPSLSVLKVKDKKILYDRLAKEYGIIPDGYVDFGEDSNFSSDVRAMLWTTVLQSSKRTNLTIFDSLRLFLLSKDVPPNNEIITDVTLSKPVIATESLISQALTDPDIAAESVSIQIINATNTIGIGQRLGRALTYKGANVVDVTSAHEMQKRTTIAYYGAESPTLDYLQTFLGIQAQKVSTEPIATIVITIGTDNANTTKF